MKLDVVTYNNPVEDRLRSEITNKTISQVLFLRDGDTSFGLRSEPGGDNIYIQFEDGIELFIEAPLAELTLRKPSSQGENYES
jgi:hypothetical protein